MHWFLILGCFVNHEKCNITPPSVEHVTPKHNHYQFLPESEILESTAKVKKKYSASTVERFTTKRNQNHFISSTIRICSFMKIYLLALEIEL